MAQEALKETSLRKLANKENQDIDSLGKFKSVQNLTFTKEQSQQFELQRTNYEQNGQFVLVDRFELEGWERKIRGFLIQKSDLEKEIILRDKDIEQLQFQLRKYEEKLRLSNIENYNLSSQIGGYEDKLKQTIREKTSLVTSNASLTKKYNDVKQRHDQMEIELQRVKLLAERERDRDKETISKMSSLRSTPSKKDPQKLFLELQKKNTEIESLQRSNDYLEKVIKDFGRSNHSTHQIDTTLTSSEISRLKDANQKLLQEVRVLKKEKLEKDQETNKESKKEGNVNNKEQNQEVTQLKKVINEMLKNQEKNEQTISKLQAKISSGQNEKKSEDEDVEALTRKNALLEQKLVVLNETLDDQKQQLEKEKENTEQKLVQMKNAWEKEEETYREELVNLSNQLSILREKFSVRCDESDVETSEFQTSFFEKCEETLSHISSEDENIRSFNQNQFHQAIQEKEKDLIQNEQPIFEIMESIPEDLSFEKQEIFKPFEPQQSQLQSQFQLQSPQPKLQQKEKEKDKKEKKEKERGKEKEKEKENKKEKKDNKVKKEKVLLQNNFQREEETSTRKDIYRAIYDYAGKVFETGNLSFKKGDEIVLIEIEEDGWWKGYLKHDSSNVGLFPGTFVIKVE